MFAMKTIILPGIRALSIAALMDEDTDLYLESRECVLDILKEELAGNPYRLLEV